MKIILTENQLSNTIIQFIKKEGSKNTRKMMGLSWEEFAEIFFNDNPMEFLNIFNDLNVVQSEEEPNHTLFRYEKGNNMMVYDSKENAMYVNADEIWLFLQDGFKLPYETIQELIQKWVDDVFNLKSVIPIWIAEGWYYTLT
jgi:hypothetical protein